MKIIDDFHGDNFFLDNFYPSPFVYMGHRWKTVEHAFQAMKTHDLYDRRAIRLAADPGEAKAMGQRVHMRKDWGQIKYGIMHDLVRIKFTTHEDLAQLLIDTYPAELIEGNTWDDTTWGVCKGVGTNWLGKILMDVREKLIVARRNAS